MKPDTVTVKGNVHSCSVPRVKKSGGRAAEDTVLCLGEDYSEMI